MLKEYWAQIYCSCSMTWEQILAKPRGQSQHWAWSGTHYQEAEAQRTAYI